ncbi:MAG TPA: amine dehydrogenase large subunit, partial [Hyphomicrobium sp.]|nr:amine dehydrogenase large subunit [Hyphomicrobium sp.]
MTHIPTTTETLKKYRIALLSGVASLVLAGAANAQQGPSGAEVPKQLGASATSELEDTPEILKAPAPDARRIYITDPAHFAVNTRTFTVDGNDGKVLGMIDGGFLTNPFAATDGSYFGQASTIYSRVSHGKRDDYIEVFDAKSHEPIADIDIPESRFLVGTYPWMTTVTPDNKSLLFYQFTPSPQVGLVDIENKKFVNMIDVPDCYHIFPSSNDTFFMHCRDGSMAKVKYGKDGKSEVTQTKPFHGEDDYLI